MTPHINAKLGEIAKLVLMPGDPLRAKFIAENYLDNPKLVNTIRNVLMYTGTYKGKEVSICASGMGQPSIGIYAYELFKFYNVEKIVRIGSAGAYTKKLKIYDLVLAKSSYYDSTHFSELVLNEKTHIQLPTEKFNNDIIETAKRLKLKLNIEHIHSSDVFYSSTTLEETIKRTQGAECVEMESHALFITAKKLNKQAACLLTISDSLVSKEELSAEDRQKKFHEMFVLALEAI